MDVAEDDQETNDQFTIHVSEPVGDVDIVASHNVAVARQAQRLSHMTGQVRTSRSCVAAVTHPDNGRVQAFSTRGCSLFSALMAESDFNECKFR